MRAEQLTAPVAHHGEGPVWWDGWGGLKFVDLLAGDVLTLHGTGEVTRTQVGRRAAALRPRVGGGAVLATERAFALASRDDLSDVRELPEVWADRGIRFNDGGCDPEGRFWCGTMAYAGTPGAGAMYRLSAGDGGGATGASSADGSADGQAGGQAAGQADVQGYAVQRQWGGVTISNGFAFSPDQSRAYYVDTPSGAISVLDRVDGELGERRELVQTGGSPDGLCVDLDGGIWVAMFGGSAVRRYTAEGRLDQVVELPVSQVTACTFGGDDLGKLFITTSAEGIDRSAEPEAGALFSVRPGTAGLPCLPFRG